jgi:hypothetical protein
LRKLLEDLREKKNNFKIVEMTAIAMIFLRISLRAKRPREAIRVQMLF